MERHNMRTFNSIPPRLNVLMGNTVFPSTGGTMGSSHSSKSKSKPSVAVQEITSIDRAILDLKNARDRLRQYQMQLERDHVKLTSKALECKKARNEKAAMNLLKLRQYKMREADNVNNQLLKVYEMIHAIGNKMDEALILDALRQGTSALKQLHEEKSVDDVLQIMEDAKEEIDIENEVCGIMGVDSMMSEAEDDDILLELEEMEREITGVVPSNTTLPSVPTSKLPDLSENTRIAVSDNGELASSRVAVVS